MSLQVFNPVDAPESIAIVVDYKANAKQLLASCAAEIKAAHQPEPADGPDETPRTTAVRIFSNFIARLDRKKINFKEYPSGNQILEAPLPLKAAIVLEAMTQVAKNRHHDFVADCMCDELLSSFLRRKLPYTGCEISRMLILVDKDSLTGSSLPLLSVLSNVERYVGEHGLSKQIRNDLQRLAKTYYPNAYGAQERKAGVRVQGLLDRPLVERGKKPVASKDLSTPKVTPAAADEMVAFEINTGEAWTNALLVELGDLSDAARLNWHQLLDHSRSAKSSKPTKKWLKRMGELLEPIGLDAFVNVVCPAFAAIGQSGESERFNYCGRIVYGEPTLVHQSHVDMLRGMVWATALIDNETLIGIVGDAAEKCFQKVREVGPRCPKIGNACLIALSSLASESAVAQLGRLKSRAKHVSTRKQIAKAFAQAAENAGISEADLVELGVPRFDMTESGKLKERFGEFAAEAIVHANRKTELSWIRADGKAQKTVPTVVKSNYANELKAFKKKLRDIEKIMPSVRQRVEHLFLNQRQWTMADFRKRFLDHPIVGVVAQKLIWNIEIMGTDIPAFWFDDQFVDSNDQVIEVEDQTKVSIWHPMQASAEAVLQWRRWLETREIVQPFKQAHREIYILTDAERATVTHSNRFASHIVRQHQFAALCQQRGWRYHLQGDWDSWNAPFIDLPQHNLRVEFLVNQQEELNEVTAAFIYTLITTEQVRFLSMNEGGSIDQMQPVPLEQIPPLVFSEILRNVDLFVGVTSIGNDPEWQERHAVEGNFDYWQSFSFGELSETAITRKAILENVIPQLQIANQCHLEEKFLVVKGQLRTYKIHLGSGNILMSPNDQYLCIVQSRGTSSRRTDNIYLPFEGDNTLSLILSKAFLLAADDKIKDATIVNQIRLDRDV